VISAPPHRVQTCDHANAASRRVLERLGFRRLRERGELISWELPLR
jgi:RimJ/RimL family protein N-acetyltransferase